jgi:hypothetical protein
VDLGGGAVKGRGEGKSEQFEWRKERLNSNAGLQKQILPCVINQLSATHEFQE